MERKGKADYIFMETAKTIIPAALSFVFKPFIDKSVWQKKHPYPFYANYGSSGIGCTINRSILVSATKYPKNRILFNGKDCSFPTVQTALKYLTPETVIINIDSQLPLGWGFGVSGASALGALYCANRLLNLKIADSTLEKIMDESFIFVRENNLLTAKTLSLIRKIHKLGGRATMNILGEVVLSTIALPLIKLRQEELIITDQTALLIL